MLGNKTLRANDSSISPTYNHFRQQIIVFANRNILTWQIMRQIIESVSSTNINTQPMQAFFNAGRKIYEDFRGISSSVHFCRFGYFCRCA